MTKKLLTFVLAAGIAVSVLPEAFGAGRAGLQIKGSDTMVNLVQAWAEAFMEKTPEAFIAVTGGGSGTGFAALINGTCDIAAASRQIKPKEISLAHERGVDPQEFKVAMDGLAVVVHPDNSVSKLTLAQLADIFTGKITNWKELGGADAAIVILSREVNSGTHIYFKEHVLDHTTGNATEFSPDALLLPSSQAIADEISQNPNAIGYYGMGYISENQKALSVAAKEGEEYFYPTLENVVSGVYPISRPLYIYTKGEPEGELKDFVDYVLSDEGQAVVTEIDFVPIRVVSKV